MKKFLSNLRYIDYYMLASALLLLTIGAIVVYSLSVTRGQMALFNQHFILIFVGLAIAFILSALDYRKISGVSILLYFSGIILLLFTLFYGSTQFGAKSWIDIGAFQFQPSEMMKVFLIIVLARIFAASFGKITGGQFLMALFLIALPIFLILRQPDLGTAMVVTFIAIIMLLNIKLPKIYWVIMLILGAVASLVVWNRLEGYQISRLQTFLDPTADPYGEGYNVIQSMIAVGNGGLHGRGIGEGTQSQLDFLPVVHSDFIFAGIAEISGFLGSTFVVIVFTILIIRALITAKNSVDNFGSFLAIGIASFWLFQFGVNVGMVLGLAPITGIPLPFVSYGGTAMIVNLAALGIIESIAIISKKASFRL